MTEKPLFLHRNEYYFEHSPRVQALLKGPVPSQLVSTYATRQTLDDFIKTLANELGVMAQRVTLYHGAEDALFKMLSWAAARGMRVHTTSHGWAEYMRMMQGLELEVCQTPLIETVDAYHHPREAFQAALGLEKSPALVLLASPNNPTGHDIPANDIITLAERFPQHVFLVDRVYTEFSRETFAALSRCENVITLGSFSKFFGLPGLRVGFAIGQVPAVQSMALGPSPWALDICSAALADCQFYKSNWMRMQETAASLQSLTTRVGHFMKTAAPFVLFRCNAQVNEKHIMHAQNEAMVRGKIIGISPEMQIRWSLGSPDAYQRIVNCIEILEQTANH